jgi:hypothetical protein
MLNVPKHIERNRGLVIVKLAHTAVWALLAGCVVLIPVASALRQYIWAQVMAGLVLVECVVLAVNKGRCPLTDVAAVTRTIAPLTLTFICRNGWRATTKPFSEPSSR